MDFRRLQAGLVFTSNHLKKEDEHSLGMVFMPMLFMDEEHRKELLAAEIVFLYEYIDKASPRSVNGMPTFFSVQMLDKQDYGRLYPKVREVMQFREKFEGDAAPATAEPKNQGSPSS